MTRDKKMFGKLPNTRPLHFSLQRGVKNRRVATVFSASPLLTLPDLIDERISEVRFAPELSFAVVSVQPNPTGCLTPQLFSHLFHNEENGFGHCLDFRVDKGYLFFPLSVGEHRNEKGTVYDIARTRRKVSYSPLIFSLIKEYPE